MTYHEQVKAFKRQLLTAAIREHGSVMATAKALHMNRTYLQELCTRLEVPHLRRNGRRGNWGDDRQLSA